MRACSAEPARKGRLFFFEKIFGSAAGSVGAGCVARASPYTGESHFLPKKKAPPSDEFPLVK